MKTREKFRNRLSRVLKGLGCAAIVAGMSLTASADLTFFYDFDPSDAGLAINKGSIMNGQVGTLDGVTISGGVATLSGDSNTGGINTGITLNTLGMRSGPDSNTQGDQASYTSMAWVNFPAYPAGHGSNDMLVFGQTTGGSYLHNGIRGDKHHIGHWGNDQTGSQVLNTNTWYHLTEQYKAGGNGLQSITVLDVSGNVVEQITVTGRAGVRSDGELKIGNTNDTQNRSFLGQLDNVMILNENLETNQIQHLAMTGDYGSLPASSVATTTTEVVLGETWVQDPSTGKWNSVNVVRNTVDGPASIIGNGVSTAMSYTDALNSAQVLGGTLFLPQGSRATADAQGLIRENTLVDLTDTAVEGTFQRADSTIPAYQPWRAGEPNNAGVDGEDQAVLVNTNGGYDSALNDIPSSLGANQYLIQNNEQLDSRPLLPSAGLHNTDFTVRMVRGVEGGSQQLSTIESALRTGQGTQTDHTAPVLNFNDEGAGPGFVPGDVPYPGDQPGAQDNFGFVADALVQVQNTGWHTVNLHGDDGISIRIVGAEFSASNSGVTGAHLAAHQDDTGANSDTLQQVFPTGASNTTGQVWLQGNHTYRVQIMGQEIGGGAYHEVSIAEGQHEAFNAGDFRLINHKATPTINVPGHLISAAGWEVTTTAPGSLTQFNLAGANADLAANGQGSVNHNYIDFGDPQSGFGGGDFQGPAEPFDNDTPADDNAFSVLAEATLQIDVAGEYHIGFRGDDGGSLQIVGGVWNSIVEQAVASVINGDTLEADFNTGNSKTVGSINLGVGTYTIRGVFWENSGGANWEIFGGLAGGNIALLSAPYDIVDFDAAMQVVPVPGAFGLGMVVMAGLGMRRGRRNRA